MTLSFMFFKNIFQFQKRKYIQMLILISIRQTVTLLNTLVNTFPCVFPLRRDLKCLYDNTCILKRISLLSSPTFHPKINSVQVTDI